MLPRLVDVSVPYSSSGFANLYDMYSSFGGLCLCVVHMCSLTLFS